MLGVTKAKLFPLVKPHLLNLKTCIVPLVRKNVFLLLILLISKTEIRKTTLSALFQMYCSMKTMIRKQPKENMCADWFNITSVCIKQLDL